MSKRTFLVFDSDGSLATIGGDKGVEEHLGLPPVHVEGVDSILSMLRRLFKKQTVRNEHPIFPDEYSEETRFVLNDRGQEVGLDGLIFDSLSRTALYTKDNILQYRNNRRDARGKKSLDTLDQKGYGLLKDKIVRLIDTITSMETVSVIATCHIRREKDEIGSIVEMPKIPGSAREDAEEFFDVIAYNRVKGNGRDQTYHWQVRPTERRKAKDRATALEPDEEGLIPQNFDNVITNYQSAGVPHPKILIMGHSGTGKTHSLKTINT